jgi:ABC-type polysaccharide/polyol phosphate transport system ATPase subunit
VTCVVLENVTKQFRVGGRLPAAEIDDEALLFDNDDDAQDVKAKDTTVALEDVSLRIACGERVGVIGPAGSGKSTLLACIAGLIRPSAGRIGLRGPVLSLPQFTQPLRPYASGRDNVADCARLAGIPQTVVEARVEAIAEFAGFDAALDAPVSTYPRGAFARLGIAALLYFPAALRLIDDGLPRDGAFRSRCIARLLELSDALLLVSSNLPLIEALCTRAIQLQRGRLVADGPVQAVIQRMARQDFDNNALAPRLSRREPTLRIVRPPPVEGQSEAVVLQHFSCTATAPRPSFEAIISVDAPVRLRGHLEIFAAGALVLEVQHEAAAPLLVPGAYILAVKLPPKLLAPQTFKARLQIEYAPPDTDAWRFQSVAILFLIEQTEPDDRFLIEGRPLDRKPAVQADADWAVRTVDDV